MPTLAAWQRSDEAGDGGFQEKRRTDPEAVGDRKAAAVEEERDVGASGQDRKRCAIRILEAERRL